MNDQIVSRQLISEQADAAAQRTVMTGVREENPYQPADSDAGKYWKASFERWLLAHSAPDAQGSA